MSRKKVYIKTIRTLKKRNRVSLEDLKNAAEESEKNFNFLQTLKQKKDSVIAYFKNN